MYFTPEGRKTRDYFLLLFLAGFLDALAVGAVDLLLGPPSHSSLSEMSKPPKPTTTKMSGHKFQNCEGNILMFEAKKINPMTIMATGQKSRLGIRFSFALHDSKT
jgi:hypothetical protein